MSKMMLYVFTPNVSSSCASPLPGVRADSRRFADRDDGLTFDLLGTCTFTQLRFLLFLYVGRPGERPVRPYRRPCTAPRRGSARGFDRGLRTGAMDAPRGGLGLSPIAQVICRPVPNHPASRCGTQPPTPTCRIPATCATTHANWRVKSPLRRRAEAVSPGPQPFHSHCASSAIDGMGLIISRSSTGWASSSAGHRHDDPRAAEFARECVRNQGADEHPNHECQDQASPGARGRSRGRRAPTVEEPLDDRRFVKRRAAAGATFAMPCP